MVTKSGQNQAGTRIRTLVVDDSVFMRAMLRNALDESEKIDVVGTAQNGREALSKIARLSPDVITLDIEMPGLTGLDVLRQIMKDDPRPVVMVSTKTQEGAQQTVEALELGAVNYVAKPLPGSNITVQGFRKKIIEAVEEAHSVNRTRLGSRATPAAVRPVYTGRPTDSIVIAIGISAGGPATLHQLLPALPATLPPILITQHMPAEFTGPFADRLDKQCMLSVKEACEGDVLVPGCVLLAPGSRHLRLKRRGGRAVTTLDNGPKVSGFRPSVDVMFESVAEVFGPCAIGLVLTGMGYDGADGVRNLKKKGARTMAQDQASSIVYGMPKEAAKTGCVDQVVSIEAIPGLLVEWVSTGEPALR